MRTIRLSQKQTNYPPNKIHSLGNDIKQYFTLEYRNIKLRQKNTQNVYISNIIYKTKPLQLYKYAGKKQTTYVHIEIMKDMVRLMSVQDVTKGTYIYTLVFIRYSDNVKVRLT